MTFEPGKSGNPKGRPKSGKTTLDDLRRARREVEKRLGKKLYERFIEQAFADNQVLIAAMRKFEPDLKSTEHSLDTQTADKITFNLHLGGRK